MVIVMKKKLIAGSILTAATLIKEAKDAAEVAKKDKKHEEEQSALNDIKSILQDEINARRDIAQTNASTQKELALMELQAAREREATNRMLIQEQTMARRTKEINEIRQARIDNPVSLVCPSCNGTREIDRIQGIVKCPFCDSVEVLNAAHKHVLELDGPIKKNVETNNVKESNYNAGVSNNKSGLVSKAKTAFILGIISLITVGILVIPEVIGLYYGISVVSVSRTEEVDAEIVKKAKKAVIMCAIALMLLFINIFS